MARWWMAGLRCSWMRNATVFTPVKSRIYSQGQTWKWPLTRQKLETVIYISPLTDPSGTLFMVFIANHYDCPMTYTIYFSLYRARPIERLTSALLWVSASWGIHMWSIRVGGFTNNYLMFRDLIIKTETVNLRCYEVRPNTRSGSLSWPRHL